MTLLSDRLRSGLERLDDDVVEAFETLLPLGEYLIALVQINPLLAKPGGPSDYFSHESVELFGLEPPFYDLPPFPRTPTTDLSS